MDQEVIVRYNQIVKQHKNFRNLANLDWVESQKKDPVIPTIINWVKLPKEDKRTLVEWSRRSSLRVRETLLCGPSEGVHHPGQPTLPPGYPN